MGSEGTEATAYLSTVCTRCGDLELPLGRVLLRVHDESATAECVIRCPTCRSRFTKACNNEMALALLNAGIAVSVWPTEQHSVNPRRLTWSEVDRAVASIYDDCRWKAALEAI
ncbi:MAG: hypothetical protein R2698_04770 [Microthrixaceae bacterium]